MPSLGTKPQIQSDTANESAPDFEALKARLEETAASLDFTALPDDAVEVAVEVQEPADGYEKLAQVAISLVRTKRPAAAPKQSAQAEAAFDARAEFSSCLNSLLMNDRQHQPATANLPMAQIASPAPTRKRGGSGGLPTPKRRFKSTANSSKEKADPEAFKRLLDDINEASLSASDGALLTGVSTSSGMVSMLTSDAVEKVMRGLAVNELCKFEGEALTLIGKLCVNACENSEFIGLGTICAVSESSDDDKEIDFELKLSQCLDSLRNGICILLLSAGQLSSKDTDKFVDENGVQIALKNVRNQLKQTIQFIMDSSLESNCASLRVSALLEQIHGSNLSKQLLIEIISAIARTLELTSDLLEKDPHGFGSSDEILISLAFLCMDSFFCEFIVPRQKASKEFKQRPISYLSALYGDIQFRSLMIIRWIFARHKNHRLFIFDEILLGLNKCLGSSSSSGSKKHESESALIVTSAWGAVDAKSERLCSEYCTNDGVGMQICSAAILHCIQAVIESEADNYLTGQASDEDQTARYDSFCSATLDSISHLTGYIFRFLVQKASAKTEGVDARGCLDGFLGDCLNALSSYELPSAAIVIQASCVLFLENIDKSKDPKEDAKAAAGISLDCLTSIFTRVLAIKRRMEDNESRLIRLETEEMFDFVETLEKLHEGFRNLQSSAVFFKLLQYRRHSDPAVFQVPKNRIAMTVNEEPTRELNVLHTLIIEEGLFCAPAFDRFLLCLLHFLNDANISSRIKAMKSLMSCQKVEPKLLANANICALVTSRLSDSSSSVRECALEMFSTNLILSGKDNLLLCYESISACLSDSSTSVRKRCVRVLKEIYLLFAEDQVHEEVMADIAQKFKICLESNLEESTIKDLCSKALLDFWFPDAELMSAANVPDHHDLKSVEAFEFLKAAKLESLGVKEKLKLQQQLAIILKVSSSSDLTGLFTQILEKPGRAFWKIVTTIRLYACLIFRQMEKLSSYSGLKILATISRSVPESLAFEISLMKKHLLAIVRTPGADPELVYHLIVAIKGAVPLFRPETKSSPIYCFHELQFDAEDAKELQLVLADLCSKHFVKIVEVAAECICLLVAEVTGDFPLITRLLDKCFDYLSSQREFALNAGTIAQKSAPSVSRALIIAGFICSNLDFKKYPEAVEKSLGNNSPMRSAFLKEILAGEGARICFDFMCFFFHQSDMPNSVKCAVITGLGSIWASCPSLLLDTKSSAVMDSVLRKADLDFDLTLQLLLVLFEFLTKSEKANANSDEAKAAFNPRELVQSTLGSGYIQNYIDPILKIMIHVDRRLRDAAFQVVSKAISDGLVHPLQCIPYLIGTEAVEYESKSPFLVQVVSLHRELCDKYETFIHNQNMAGIQLSHELISRVDGSPCGFCVSSDGDAEAREAKLQPMYGLMREKRQRRKYFLENLTAELDVSLNKSQSITDATKEVAYAKYVAENLAYFDYKTMEEPLLIIYNLNKLLSTTAAEVSDLFTKMSKGDPVGELPENLIPGSCVVMICATLKAFLQSHYRITDSRIETFQPGDSKSNEKAVLRKSGTFLDWKSIYVKEPARLSTLVVDQNEEALKAHLHEFLEMDANVLASPTFTGLAEYSSVFMDDEDEPKSAAQVVPAVRRKKKLAKKSKEVVAGVEKRSSRAAKTATTNYAESDDENDDLFT